MNTFRGSCQRHLHVCDVYPHKCWNHRRFSLIVVKVGTSTQNHSESDWKSLFSTKQSRAASDQLILQKWKVQSAEAWSRGRWRGDTDDSVLLTDAPNLTCISLFGPRFSFHSDCRLTGKFPSEIFRNLPSLLFVLKHFNAVCVFLLSMLWCCAGCDWET